MSHPSPSSVFKTYSHQSQTGFHFLYDCLSPSEWYDIDEYYRKHQDPCPKHASMLTRPFRVVGSMTNVRAVVLIPCIFTHYKLDTGLPLEIPIRFQSMLPSVFGIDSNNDFSVKRMMEDAVVFADTFYSEFNLEELEDQETQIAKSSRYSQRYAQDEEEDANNSKTKEKMETVNIPGRQLRRSQEATVLDIAWWSRKLGILFLCPNLSTSFQSPADLIPKRQKTKDELPHSPWYLFTLNLVEQLYRRNPKLIAFGCGVESQEIITLTKIPREQCIYGSWIETKKLCQSDHPFSRLLLLLYDLYGLEVEPSSLCVSCKDKDYGLQLDCPESDRDVRLYQTLFEERKKWEEQYGLSE